MQSGCLYSLKETLESKTVSHGNLQWSDPSDCAIQILESWTLTIWDRERLVAFKMIVMWGNMLRYTKSWTKQTQSSVRKSVDSSGPVMSLANDLTNKLFLHSLQSEDFWVLFWIYGWPMWRETQTFYVSTTGKKRPLSEVVVALIVVATRGPVTTGLGLADRDREEVQLTVLNWFTIGIDTRPRAVSSVIRSERKIFSAEDGVEIFIVNLVKVPLKGASSHIKLFQRDITPLWLPNFSRVVTDKACLVIRKEILFLNSLIIVFFYNFRVD